MSFVQTMNLRVHNVLRLQRTSKAVSDTHTFLWGKVFDGKRGGRKNNNCGLNGLANFEIAKALIIVNINLYRPYCHFS